MSGNVDRDKRTRKAHRIHVRRLISEANELSLIFDEMKPEHRQKLKHYKSTLKRKSDVISDLDRTILGLIKEEDVENEIEESSEFMDAIDLTLVALEEVKIAEEEQTQRMPQSAYQNTSSSSSNNRVRARLPKLQLSIFDGKSTEWLPPPPPILLGQF